MAEFFSNYGLFFAKTLTLVIAFAVVMAIAVSAGKKGKAEGQLEIRQLNQHYQDLESSLKSQILSKTQLKDFNKHEKTQAKKAKKNKQENDRKRVFVLDFKGDIKATAALSLKEEINALLTLLDKSDEVLLRLENAGGLVHEHGLAASQLQRLKTHGVQLTISVDKVAASGGYLMACLGHKIIAAPFAILGSIGVLAQLPNFHRLLNEHGVEFEQIKAGEFKRTVTMFGKNTADDRKHMQTQVDDIHTLFKDYVAEHRPNMDINAVATGEHWHGVRALEFNLVDELKTSDEYLMQARNTKDIYELRYQSKKVMSEKIASLIQSSLEASFIKVLSNLRFWRY